MPFPQIDTEHAIAQFHEKTGRFINFDIPDYVIADDYAGPMLTLHGKLSLCITPNTNLYVSRSNDPQRRIQPLFSLRSAQDRLTATQHLYQAPLRLCRVGDVRNCSDIGHDAEMYAFGQLIGFFLGDGHAESTNQIVFMLTKHRKQTYLRHIMSMIPYDLKEVGDRFVVRYPLLGETFRRWFYTADDQKRFPSFLFHGTVPYYLGILDGLKNSDGYQRAGCEGWEYATTSPYIADMMQAMGALVGQAFSVTERVPGLYRLYTLQGQTYPHINDARTNLQILQTDYEDWVYDVIMPYPLVCVRHRGTTLLCGTSDHVGDAYLVY